MSVRLLHAIGQPGSAEALDHTQATLTTLRARLEPLVGAGARSSDPMVRSPLAYTWAFQYLLRLLDLPRPE
jgi:hypothetical protein